jgi:hypothetical protein
MPASESDHRNTAGRWNPATSGNCAECWPKSGHGQKIAGIQPDSDTDPAGSGQNVRNPAGYDRIWLLIRPDLAKWPESGY